MKTNPAIWVILGGCCLPNVLMFLFGWFLRGRRELFQRMKREGLFDLKDDE